MEGKNRGKRGRKEGGEGDGEIFKTIATLSVKAVPLVSESVYSTPTNWPGWCTAHRRRR